jgi:hypothetical protein
MQIKYVHPNHASVFVKIHEIGGLSYMKIVTHIVVFKV